MAALISYAYNHEDVLLRRVFGGVERGFYIDVGAFDPVEGSITKHFYDRGWSGINVEASPVAAAKFEAARPRDVTLVMGASDRPGELDFFEFAGRLSGLSTFERAEAEAHVKAREAAYVKRRVPTTTLAEICERHAVGDISFLSVDVEGHELAVLRGADWRRWRPRVVVVEATRPMSSEPSHESWEPVLLGADYLFATFDGLNRYYVRAEDRGDVEKLKTPVNIFDDYEPYVHHRRVERLEAELRFYRLGTLYLLEPANALRRFFAARGGVRAAVGRAAGSLRRGRRGG
jgi:FkbM family methyltransferase